MTNTTTHLDRNGLEVLGPDECLDLLASQAVGRLAYTHVGGPTILPVSYVVSHGGVAFRSASGSKLDARGLEPWSDHLADGAWVLVLAEEISGRRV